MQEGKEERRSGGSVRYVHASAGRQTTTRLWTFFTCVDKYSQEISRNISPWSKNFTVVVVVVSCKKKRKQTNKQTLAPPWQIFLKVNIFA